MADFSKKLSERVNEAKALLQSTNLPAVQGPKDLLQNSDLAIDFGSIDQILAGATVESDYPPLMKQAMEALRSPNAQPATMFGLLERFSNRSHTKTYNSRSEEVGAMLGYMAQEQNIYAHRVQAAQLPEKLKREHEMTQATHKAAILQTAQAAAVYALSVALIREAANRGISIETYMVQLADQQALAKKKEELAIEREHEVEKQRQLKQIDRLDELERGQNEIKAITEATMSQRLQERRLRDELRQAYIEKDAITQDGTLSQSLKSNLLDEKDDDIRSLKRRIRDLEPKDPTLDTGKIT